MNQQLKIQLALAITAISVSISSPMAQPNTDKNEDRCANFSGADYVKCLSDVIDIPRQEAKRAADQEAKRAADAKLSKLFASSSAQALYLAAGKSERENELETAVRIYERIIEKHASTPYAEKANDRLLALNDKAKALASQSRQDTATVAQSESKAAFPKLACVSWQVEWSTNPFFKNADIVRYQITGNIIEATSNQCEVKIKSQKRTTFISDNPPFRNNETTVVECDKLSRC
jgi:hypothetical protein